MKRQILNIGLILCIASLPLTAQRDDKIDKSHFRHPPGQYYPMPFWHINGEMTNEGIRNQMEDAKFRANFNGVAVLPVGSTKPDFLSEEYFQQYHYLLETARELNMKVILYDDTGFPSGTAGGQLEKKFPDDIRKIVNKHETIRKGPSLWRAPVPHGQLLAAVAMHTESRKRIDIRGAIKAGILSWRVPEGNWKIMFFTCNKAPYYKKYFPVDYLDTSAVARFINLTYDEYAHRFESYFQNTIQLTFFDDVGFLRTERTWTNSFNEKFIEINGFKPDIYYPALWYDIGPETSAARVALFNTRSELMAEGYPKMVSKWTRKHGLKNTGHPPGNYAIQPVDMHGDIFKYYRYTDIPLTDLIIQYGRGRDGFKLISSASDYYDRPITSTEIYGALKEDVVDSLMLYRGLMEILARGVNFVIPHGMWYDPEHVQIPPLISPFSKKLAGGLSAYSDYVGRTCYLLQGGRRVADIAVIYPIASLQAGFYFNSPDNKRAGTWAYPEADYLKISNLLTNEIRRDFTFVHPEFLVSDKYEIQNDILQLDHVKNYQEYRLVIIPGGKVISIDALRKIKDYYDHGGKVMATTMLPEFSAEFGRDDQVRQLVSELFGEEAGTNPKVQTNNKGGKAIFVPDPTNQFHTEIINGLIPAADVSFDPVPEVTSELGLFSYIHKVRDGKDIYFFANSSDQVIETDVLLRGQLKLEEWDPHTGKVSNISKVSYLRENGQNYSRCRLQLKPVSSTLWIGS